MAETPLTATTEFRARTALWWEKEAEAGRIWLVDQLGENLSFAVMQQLARVERDENAKFAEIHIDTPGGNGYGMLAIVDLTRSMRTPVTTFVEGAALSAGCVIAAAGRTRYANAHSVFLFHGAWHTLGWQKSRDAALDADFAQRYDDMMCQIMAKLTKKPLRFWRSIVHAKAEDRWFTADEALEWGVVDEILQWR